MQFCGCLLFFCLSVSLLHCSVDGFRVQHRAAQHIDRPQPGSQGKAGGQLTEKLLRIDQLARMENDVMEPKRKRSFPGNSVPMDRLSISSMETKLGSNKQSKKVETSRRRINPPPIDRVGMSRLPNSRG
ncbi:osteocrin [Scomber scombrus]|nr:osteocrin [Scomber scombrus]